MGKKDDDIVKGCVGVIFFQLGCAGLVPLYIVIHLCVEAGLSTGKTLLVAAGAVYMLWRIFSWVGSD